MASPNIQINAIEFVKIDSRFAYARTSPLYLSKKLCFTLVSSRWQLTRVTANIAELIVSNLKI